jgi:hypothetical protein
MHRHHHGHEHDHEHDHPHDHEHHHPGHPPHGPGHNHLHSHRAPVQWQTPHQPDGAKEHAIGPEPDLDKVEAAFVDGFFQAPDPTSFLRLARIPFEIAADGENLKLLRVEIDALTDVGSLTPHIGGGTFRYDPLPSNFVSRRRRLRFVYFDGASLRALSYAELRDIQTPA